MKQGSERLGLEWTDFSIGAGEQVSFDQPSRSAIALNRVTGSKASDIRGLLTANGNVFVVNRNGVIFHGSAVVDVGGLLATTSEISNADFMAGRYRFDGGTGAGGRVVNEGRITAAAGGLVALVAPSVRNAGVIEARLGKVALGSGSRFTVDLYGDELVSFAVDDGIAQQQKGVDGQAVRSRVEQSGEVDAAGGRVWLTASAAKAVVDSAINLSGVVRAQTVSKQGGRIVLSGAGPGLVQVSGEADATGGPSEPGGRIEVTGEGVAVNTGAELNASGGAGGGTVLVGGDYHGGGSLRRAAETTVAAGSVLRADATGAGDGGEVVVWSDRHTQVDGTVSARGGPAGGDGGLVETSSAGRLEFTTSARVDAPLGEAGTWLLDPADITIDRGMADSIEGTLNAGGSVSIETSDSGDGEGNLTVSASITKTAGGDASLSLTAANRLDVDAPIESQAGKLDVALAAGVSVNVNADVKTNGGGFTSRVTGVTSTTDTSTDSGSTSSTTTGSGTTTSTSTNTSTNASTDTSTSATAPTSAGTTTTPTGSDTTTDTSTGTGGGGDTGTTTTGSTDSGSTTGTNTQTDAGTGGDTTTSVDTNTDTGTTTTDSPTPTTTLATTSTDTTTDTSTSSPPTTTDSSTGTNTDTTSTDTTTTTDNTATTDTTATLTQSVDSTTQAAASSVQTDAVDTSYITVSQTVATHGGDISVNAGETGASLVTGTLDASNTDAGQKGGAIEVLGRDVVLGGNAVVDASGDAGGGDINIGGDYQGKGQRLQSRTTTVGQNVTIRSDATGKGDAGRVVVWSKGTTRYSGSISATGGPQGGDGGQVEVSGKANLGFWGTVDAGAPNGSAGSLLLDPDHLTIIDAQRGQGDEDPNLLCEANTQTCWLPSDRFLPPPGVTEDPANLYIFPDEFAALGIDPYGDTPLNTVSWGRLLQLAQVTAPSGTTGYGVWLEADHNITFAPLNGTVSTPGSPVGGTTGWTITLTEANATRVRGEYPSENALTVISDHGDIMFQNPDDNLAVYGGNMLFSAPEGELHLGNLYGPGPTEQVTTGTTWRNTSVTLTAGGDIEVGTIDTRNYPARFADPATGAPLPQPLVVGDPSTFDFGVLFDSMNLLSDPYQGGPVSITSTGGNIDIRGPVYTGSNTFFAEAAGTFTATTIDTGANRILVKSSESDPGDLNTLNTGDVDITADKITFDQINAGSVKLDALTYAPDAITGTIVFDTFRNSDFPTHRISGRDLTDPGLTLQVGDTPSIDLLFDEYQLGAATTSIPPLNTGAVLVDANNDPVLSLNGIAGANLTAEFDFTGGDIPVDTIYVAPRLPALLSLAVAPPGVIPIGVPLDLPPSGPTVTGIGFVPSPAAAPSFGGVAGGGFSPLPATGSASPSVPTSPTEITFASSADTDRIKGEGKGKQDEGNSGGCSAADRLAWLQHGAGSAAHAVDWHQPSAVGTGPEDTKNVFKAGSCYL